MEDIKKCDRCGTLYEMPERNKLTITKEIGFFNFKTLALCPQCQKELEKWLEEKWIKNKENKKGEN